MGAQDREAREYNAYQDYRRAAPSDRPVIPVNEFEIIYRLRDEEVRQLTEEVALLKRAMAGAMEIVRMLISK